MRRSVHVTAPLLVLAASAMIAGCRKPDMKRCVDEHNVVVDEKFCSNLPNNGQNLNNNYAPGHSPIFIPYHYYYGGWGGYGLGSTVGGGGIMPMSGHSYATSTSRGGFGSSFGEGGAHGGGGGGE